MGLQAWACSHCLPQSSHCTGPPNKQNDVFGKIIFVECIISDKQRECQGKSIFVSFSKFDLYFPNEKAEICFSGHKQQYLQFFSKVGSVY
jgi:hypothetical protein